VIFVLTFLSPLVIVPLSEFNEKMFYGNINIGFLRKKREIDHTLGGVYGERFDDLAGQRLHKSLVM